MATVETVLLNDNKRHRLYTGAEYFHQAGYYGERVIAATGESWALRLYNPGGLVLDPLGRGTGTATHPVSTAGVFYQFAPKAKLVMLNMTAYQSSDPDKCYIRFATESLSIIKEYNILNQFNSFSQSYNATVKRLYEDAMNAVPNLKMFWSMGNDDTEAYSRITDLADMFGVGAYRIMVDNQIIPEGFSSESITVDFAGPDMIAYNTTATSPSALGNKPSGTSYAAPAVCALACLVDDFFIDKTGKPLSRPMMFQFLVDHCEDIGDEGFDQSMGYGAVRLPDPATIEIDKYQPSGGDTSLSDEEIITVDKSNYKSIIDTQVTDYLHITEIPYESIKEVGFAKCNDPTESVKSWYDRQEIKPQIVTNGGLYTLATGNNILSFIDEGKEQNYQNGFEGLGVKYNNVAHLVFGVDGAGDWKDFMSAHPVLVENGKACNTFGSADDLNYGKIARQAIGVKKNGDIIIITVDKKPGDAISATIASTGMQFDELANLFVKYGADYAINLDGGGSVYKMEFGEVVNKPTETRSIDNVFYIKLKHVDDSTKNPAVGEESSPVELPTICPGDYYAAENIDLKVNVDTTEDNPSQVFRVISKGTMVRVNSTMVWLNKTWANVTADGERGFIWYTGSNLYAEKPSEEIKPSPEEPIDRPDNSGVMGFVPGVYVVKVNTFLTVRATPNTSGAAVGKLYNDTMINVDSITNDCWAHIRDGEYGGYYCHTDYISRIADCDGTEGKLEQFSGDYSIVRLIKDLKDVGGAPIFSKGDTITIDSTDPDLLLIGSLDSDIVYQLSVIGESVEIYGELLFSGSYQKPDESVYGCGAKIGVVTKDIEVSPVLDNERAQGVYANFMILQTGELVIVTEDECIIAENVVFMPTSKSNLLNVKLIGILATENEDLVTEDEDLESVDSEESTNILNRLDDKDFIGKSHKDGVEFVLKNGIMNGVSSTKFNPTGSITREELATVLYRYDKYRNK